MNRTIALTIRTTSALIVFIAISILISGCAGSFGTLPREPANMILFIGDGMGPEQQKAARLYRTGQEDELFIQGLPIQTSITTYSASADY